jgi:inorganic pyrophosphatase
MILRIKSTALLALLSASVFGGQIHYKKDGEYIITSGIHLIDDIPYKKKGQYQVLVEVPTGARQKWEVNHKSGQLEWEFKNDKPRKVKFLGYPGNYGFIPQTLSTDGDSLDAIVLSESANRGDTLNVKVIGMLKLVDKGVDDYKVLAVTNDGPFKKIDTIKELFIKNPNAIQIIRLWFEGYKDPGKIVFMGYSGKKKANKYIEEAHGKWLRKKH